MYSKSSYLVSICLFDSIIEILQVSPIVFSSKPRRLDVKFAYPKWIPIMPRRDLLCWSWNIRFSAQRFNGNCGFVLHKLGSVLRSSSSCYSFLCFDGKMKAFSRFTLQRSLFLLSWDEISLWPDFYPTLFLWMDFTFSNGILSIFPSFRTFFITNLGFSFGLYMASR